MKKVKERGVEEWLRRRRVGMMHGGGDDVGKKRDLAGAVVRGIENQ